MASERWPNGSTRAWKKKRAEVLERDGNRCTHRTPSGRRCAATEELEVHHTNPEAGLIPEEAPLEELTTICKKHHPRPDGEWQEKSKQAAAAARAAIAKLEVREVPIKELMPALWNANVVDNETMRRIRNSIERYGVVENCVARPHPEFEGKLEMLSGNHRLRIYKQLRLKSVPVHVVELDDAMAKVLAQTLNRTRGSDDPEKLAELMDQIHQALPKEQIEMFLAPMMELPPAGPRNVEDVLGGRGYRFRPIHPVKLGLRMVAASHPRQTKRVLELFAGTGQLSYWYGQVFDEVVRVDKNPEGEPNYNESAKAFLENHFADEVAAGGPFNLIDLDDEGSPHEELDALFAALKQTPHPPFVLTVTDGLAIRLKMIWNSPRERDDFDLMKVYRWPQKGKDRRVHLRCPELLDHGVRTRAEEAGYVAEQIHCEWKPGKNATIGAWTIGPDEDTRSKMEQELDEGEQLPETYGAWRVTLKA